MTCLCETLAGDSIEISPLCLGQLWMFRDLNADELQALMDTARRRKLTKGEPLFLQGDRAESMFLVKGGRIKLSKIMEDGSELTVDYRKAGDVVGEHLMTEETDYPFSAYPIEETLVCGFSREDFDRLVLAHPKIGLRIIRNMSERIAWLSERLGHVSVSNMEDRLMGVVEHLVKEHGTRTEKGYTLGFSLTHEDIGFLIGAHRVSVTRTMKHLKASGRIIIDQGKLSVPL